MEGLYCHAAQIGTILGNLVGKDNIEYGQTSNMTKYYYIL